MTGRKNPNPKPQPPMAAKKSPKPSTAPHHRFLSPLSQNQLAPINPTHTQSPASTYANILKRANTLPVHITQRNHPWQLFTDQNPWSVNGPITAEWGTQGDDTPQPLPTPPDPTHYLWRGRCYNCLAIGHDQRECTKKDRVCANCWCSGHQARACAQPIKPVFDPLKPRGNLGEHGMPENRPNSALVFIPESTQMQKDRVEMHRAVVVDARLQPKHDLNMVQEVLMAACNTAYPFPLTHMKGAQYLLLLQPGVDRHTFLMSHARQLQAMGYVLYSWNPAVNGYVLELKYKVWISLKNLAPLTWTIEHLLAAASSFGIVLDHQKLTNATSLDKLTMVVAVPDLSLVPRKIVMWVRSIARDIPVQVEGWIEEPLQVTAPMDTTPSHEFFGDVAAQNKKPLGPLLTENESLTVDFDTLFGVWELLREGPEKNKIDAMLRRCPNYDGKRKEKVQPQPMPMPVAVPLAKHTTDGGKGKGLLLEGSGTDTTGEEVNNGNSINEGTEKVRLEPRENFQTPVQVRSGSVMQETR